jgi:hypothetical protein
MIKPDLEVANQIIINAPKQVPFIIRDIAMRIHGTKMINDGATEKIAFNFTSNNYFDNIEAYLRDNKFINPCEHGTWKLSPEKGRLSTDPKKELWEGVSSHTARRSFVNNHYLVGFSTLDLIKITGHRD